MRVCMLEIRFQDIMDKKQIRISSNHICIMNKEPVLLQGDGASIFFDALRKDNVCSFWQEGYQLSIAQMQANTCEIKKPAFPQYMRIRSYLQREMDTKEIAQLFVSFAIPCDEKTRFLDISSFDQTRIYLYLALRKQPKFIILRYDARSCSNDQIQLLRAMLMEVIEKGCYVLMEEASANLLPHTVYNIAQLPPSYITNYIEETLDFCEHSSEIKHKKKRADVFAYLKMLVFTIFSIGSFCFILLLIIYITAFHTTFQPIKEKLSLMDEHSVYPVFFHKNNGFDMFQYLNVYPFTEEEQTILNDYREELPLYPVYSANIQPEHIKDITITKKDEVYHPQNEPYEGRFFSVSSYNAHTKKYLFEGEDDSFDETIYMSPYMAEDLFPNVDVENATMRVTINVPIYLFRQRAVSQSQYQSSSTDPYAYDYFTKFFTFEAPVKIKNSATMEGGLTISDVTFQKAYAMFHASSPFDAETFFDDQASTESYHWNWDVTSLNEIDNIQPFYPNQFLFLANEKPALDATKHALANLKYPCVYLSIYDQNIDTLQTYEQAQEDMKHMLHPVMMVIIGGILVCSVIVFLLKYWSYCIPKKALEKQDAIQYIVCVVVTTLLCVVVCWLLQQEDTTMFIREILKKILFSEEDTYEHPLYYQILSLSYLFSYSTQLNATTFLITLMSAALIVMLYQLPTIIYRYCTYRK